MSLHDLENLVPRDGHTLKVIFICRVSRPAKEKNTTKTKRKGLQDERSNDDQKALLMRWLRKHYKDAFKVRVIKGSGSGERLDRKETRRAQRLIRSEAYDLILCEDIGRVFRRVQAYSFCELAEDFEVRVIALNDHLDTGRDGWRLSAFFAAMRHEMYNADTAKRIRRGQRGRFESGGMFQHPIYGHIKANDSDHEDDVQKDLAAVPVYREWFRMLEIGATYQDVADCLNESGVPVGPNCRLKKWTCQMVSRITHNPILKGDRIRCSRVSKRVNETGRRKVVQAPPEELQVRHCPHLAFFEASYYDKVLAIADTTNAKYRPKDVDGRQPRQGVSRKRTRYPGQTAYCGICGRLYVFGGHGQRDHLMCDGARHYQCWSGATIDGPLAATKIAEAVGREIDALENFDSTYEAMLNEEVRRVNDTFDTNIKAINAEIERASAAAAFIVAEIKQGKVSKILRTELDQLEGQLDQLRLDKHNAERTRVDEVVLPPTEELKKLYYEAFNGLAIEDYRFARKLRRLVPRLVVFPYRLCDGGRVVLRAKFRLQLSKLVPHVGTQVALQQMLEKLMQVDLFDPPAREKFRTQVMSLRASGLTEKEVANHLGLTVTVAQQAAALQRRMDELGITDPYLPMLQPADDCTKLRRQLHKRYRFEPLDDAGTV